MCCEKEISIKTSWQNGKEIAVRYPLGTAHEGCYVSNDGQFAVTWKHRPHIARIAASFIVLFLGFCMVLAAVLPCLCQAFLTGHYNLVLYISENGYSIVPLMFLLLGGFLLALLGFLNIVKTVDTELDGDIIRAMRTDQDR